MYQLFDWIRDRPFVSILLALLSLWGYSNIFVYGFLVKLPPAIRPFLDSYFFANISVEFFASLTVSIATGRVLVLLFSYSLKSINPNFAETISWFWPLTNVLVFPGQKFSNSSRKASIAARFTARWIKKRKLFLTNVLSLLTFAVLFLDEQSYWFVPISVISLPVLWVVISRVELRRDFATTANSRGISRRRLISSLSTLVLVHLAIVSFLAGIATFQNRMSNEVSIGAGNLSKDSSLLSVTSTGIVAGRYIFDIDGTRIGISVHFLPYGSFSSVGQKF